jgi:hypothetical protein
LIRPAPNELVKCQPHPLSSPACSREKKRVSMEKLQDGICNFFRTEVLWPEQPELKPFTYKCKVVELDSQVWIQMFRIRSAFRKKTANRVSIRISFAFGKNGNQLWTTTNRFCYAHSDERWGRRDRPGNCFSRSW